MIETDLVKLILVSLYQKFPNSLWYRRNVGAFKNKDRFVRFGLPGMADIGGIHIGKAIEIEVKTFKGKQTEEQKNWQKAVENAKGIYILSYDVETVIEIIKNLN